MREKILTEMLCHPRPSHVCLETIHGLKNLCDVFDSPSMVTFECQHHEQQQERNNGTGSKTPNVEMHNDGTGGKHHV